MGQVTWPEHISSKTSCSSTDYWIKKQKSDGDEAKWRQATKVLEAKGFTIDLAFKKKLVNINHSNLICLVCWGTKSFRIAYPVLKDDYVAKLLVENKVSVVQLSRMVDQQLQRNKPYEKNLIPSASTEPS